MEKRCGSYACKYSCALRGYLERVSPKHPDEPAAAFDTFTDCPYRDELARNFAEVLARSREARSKQLGK